MMTRSIMAQVRHFRNPEASMPVSVSIEYCTTCHYLPKAKLLEKEILKEAR